jgi:hypothetical protein
MSDVIAATYLKEKTRGKINFYVKETRRHDSSSFHGHDFISRSKIPLYCGSGDTEIHQSRQNTTKNRSFANKAGAGKWISNMLAKKNKMSNR